MDESGIRALLTLMNLSAPACTEWCAWQPEKDWLPRDYEVLDHWRFYLVGQGSELHNSDSGNILWGERL